jgi:hypothetical protein
MKKPFCFNNIQTFLFVFILFFILHIIYLIIFPHEAFCMIPYDDIISGDDIISDEDVSCRLIISRKENYMSYNGNKTYNTKLYVFRSLYPKGLLIDSSIINDSYDGEKYFDIPLTMICGESKNIDLSPGVYSGCIARNIDGLLI